MANLETYKTSTLTCQLILSTGNCEIFITVVIEVCAFTTNTQGFDGSPLVS